MQRLVVSSCAKTPQVIQVLPLSLAGMDKIGILAGRSSRPAFLVSGGPGTIERAFLHVLRWRYGGRSDELGSYACWAGGDDNNGSDDRKKFRHDI